MTNLMKRLFAASVCIAVHAVPALAAVPPLGARPEVRREVTLPAGTVLRVRVDRGFGSDTSRVEDEVHGTVVRAVTVRGTDVLPPGSTVSGYVASAVRPGRVRGRGRVAVRFTHVRTPGEGEPYVIRTRIWAAVAPATKQKDALTIGAPAAGGAVLGGIIGGKKGAGIGALAGGGGGTALVLSTRGKDVRVARGAVIAVRLAAPLTVRVE